MYVTVLALVALRTTRETCHNALSPSHTHTWPRPHQLYLGSEEHCSCSSHPAGTCMHVPKKLSSCSDEESSGRVAVPLLPLVCVWWAWHRGTFYWTSTPRTRPRLTTHWRNIFFSFLRITPLEELTPRFRRRKSMS